jgi:DNA polymerase III epsilon subunit-like protein
MSKIVVIDVETGGLDPALHSILTLGACIWDNGIIMDDFYVVIKEPELSITPEALKVNGLTEEQIALGVTPTEAVVALEQWAKRNGIYGRYTVGGHNISGFDMGFLKRLYRIACVKMPFEYHVVDTMTAAILLKYAGKISVKNFKLDTLCQHYGIVIRADGASGVHNSGEDAIATANLFTRLLAEINSQIVPT